MGVLKLLSTEFAKLTANKGILASIIVALLVPVVYGGILLSPKWSPYDNLSNLPVAVVNNDKGAINGEEPLHVGNQLVDSLKKSESLGWDFVDSSQAMRGLQNNDYYMVVVIPEDFSQRVTTVMDADPKKVELEYIQNEGLNFLASQVTNSATEKIRETLANTITAQYTSQVFSSLDQVAEGFEKAAEGSEQLADGTTQLHTGTNELNQSVTEKMADISRLADGTKELKAGTSLLLENLQDKSGDISKLADGSKELHEGLVSLNKGTNDLLVGLLAAEKGSKDLVDGINGRLVDGSRSVADGTLAVKDGAAALAEGAKKLVDGLESYRNVNVTVRVGPYYQQIVDGANEILAGLNKLSTSSVGLADGADKVADGLETSVSPGIVKLNNGLKQLVGGQNKIIDGVGKLEVGAKQIADGNSQVRAGWTDLTNGVTTLDSGAGQIASGNQEVNQGWKTLAEGTTKLNDGAEKVNEGSEELATGLKDGAEKTGGLNTGQKNVDMFSSPVELVADKVNGYEYYRDSTAPYIITLGLFVGILIMSLFINFKKPEQVSSIQWFTIKFLKLASLAVAQAFLLLLVVLFVLKLDVTNPLGFILFANVASIVFASIVLFLAAVGGNIGRFIALAFVVLQLSTTGANLPIDMLPEGLRSLSSYLPFTYSIEGLKSVISLNDFGNAMLNLTILIGFGLIFATLTLGTLLIKYRNQTNQTEISM